MANTNILLKQLISSISGLSESSYENKISFKKCCAFLRQYHPLEVNPKFVDGEIEKLCEKLEINSLNFKSEAVKKFTKKLVNSCDYSNNLDSYLMIYGVILFLLEINGSMVNSFEYGGIEDDVETTISEEVNWGEILTKSEDIVSLTRENYSSDESSEFTSDSEEECDITLKKTEIIAIKKVDNISYKSIESTIWDKSQIDSDCTATLQPEYWLHSFDTKFQSKKTLQQNNCDRSFSVFVDNCENFIQQTNPTYYHSDYRNRIEISEYQLIRELIDVLMGSFNSLVFTSDHDSHLITRNRFQVAKSIKLINLSWKSIDNILQLFSLIATDCLQLRASCTYIIKSNSQSDLPPTIVAFGERLHYYLNEFHTELLRLESKSRGNNGISLMEVMHVVTDLWGDRLRLLGDIVRCVTGGRFEAFTCNQTVVDVLNLLYRLMNESCLMGANDRWASECIIDLFHHSFQPYLHSVDALLSGQVHISPQNLFLIPRSDSLFHRIAINDYWKTSFSLRQSANLHHQHSHERLLNDVPLLLQPFIVPLISTMKAIDLLRILSIELTRPALLNGIIIEPGRFIENFNDPRRQSTVPCEVVALHRYRFKEDFILPKQHVALHSICDRLTRDLSCHLMRETIDVRSDSVGTVGRDIESDLTDASRQLHSNLLRNIVDRYRSVNCQLVATYIDHLGLRRALNSLQSIYFFQAGVEMYDFCGHMFDTICNCSYDSADLVLNFNVKLQHILSDSASRELRLEAQRFSVSLLPSTDVALSLPAISVAYEAEWHLRVVITDELLSVCDKCFRFLLQLRFTKHCLEMKIHTARGAAEAWSLLSSRLCSLRLKLLQITNNFHGYVMNTFIVPSWEALHSTLDQPLQQSEDFTDFIAHISEPFQTMLRGCLQSKGMDSIEKAIRRVVSLGVLASQLNVGSGESRIREIEDKYNRLVDFLSAMFRSLAHLGVSIGELDISAFK